MKTIIVPRNLGQITDWLPPAQYNSNPNPLPLKRNSSEPGRIGVKGSARDNLSSAKPYGVDNNLKPLMAVIKEKDEQPRSADPNKDTGFKNKQPIHYNYRRPNKVPSQQYQYQYEKENNPKLPRIQDNKSYL